MFNLYEGDYKKYLFIPAILFVIFLILIFVTPGITPGIDLKGGTSIIVRSDSPLSIEALEPVLVEKYNLTELQLGTVSSPAGYGLFLQFSENADLAQAESLLDKAQEQLSSNPDNAKQLALQSITFSSKFTSVRDASSLSPSQAVESAEQAALKADESFHVGLQNTISETFGLGDDIKIQKREIGPSLGENFFNTGITVSVIGFLLVLMVVFLFFREVLPSIAIILAIIFDIFGALALMSVFGIPLSLATIPALLMLIGYSVDTDLMLTTRLLKRKEGTPRERAHGSMLTGLTMTVTTLAALTVMATLSYFGQLQVVFEISAVLLFGLLADLLSTWLMNTPMLLWYVERKEESI